MSPFSIHLRHLCALLVAGMGLLAASDAQACQRLLPGDQNLDDNRSMPNIDQPDRYYSGNGGFFSKAYRCPPGQETFVIDMALSGLTYVRDIRYENRTFAAYRLSERSPLIGFQYQLAGAAGMTPTALHPGRIHRSEPFDLTAETDVDAGVVMLYFFPGGAIESAPYRNLGTIVSWPESNPSQTLLHSVSLGFNVPVATCTLVDHALTLPDVSADDLAQVGVVAHETAFDMMMACPSANVDVTLSLADANDAGNTGSVLTATANTTAGGVQVQVLRGGMPVQFQQAWHFGYSSKGDQPVGFSARYVRNPEELRTGIVEGQAVLTADYR